MITVSNAAMDHSNIKQFILAACAVAASAVIAPAPAQAETIYLTCTPTDGLAPVSFTVDLEKNTVDNQPATINPTAIDWLTEGGTASPASIASITTHNHIDRAAGTWTRYTVFHLTSGQDTRAAPTLTRAPWVRRQ